MPQDRKGLYQRNQAVKYLKKGFYAADEEPQDLDDEDVLVRKELESNVLFMASLANSMLYVGDQLFELVSILSEKPMQHEFIGSIKED